MKNGNVLIPLNTHFSGKIMKKTREFS